MEKTKRRTQEQRVLDHLKLHGTIDDRVARSEYGIMHLKQVIWVLRSNGSVIDTKIMTGKNKFNEPVKWAKYFIKTEKSN